MNKLYLMILVLGILFTRCDNIDSVNQINNSENLKEDKGISSFFKCSDECSSNNCNDKNEVLECFNNSKGCMEFENKGVQIGQCNAECIKHTDCNGDNICRDSKCIEKDTKYFSDLIRDTDMSFSYNKQEIREYFYLKVNELRYKNGKKEIEVSKSIENSADTCASLDFWIECEIESNQAGVNWQIPWYSNVEGCGFAASSKSSVDCLFSSLEDDKDSETRIYEELISKNKIGLGIINKGEDISYSITLE